jgi:DNA-binding SARP family transcriptional activator
MAQPHTDSMSYQRLAHEAAQEKLLSIRMLGPLEVRRPDGSIVDPTEWRTKKAADLVRLLALHDGELVPRETVLKQLWPDAERPRALASLRTANCHARQVIGNAHLERNLMGMRLVNVWVDVTRLRALTVEAHHAAENGAPSDVRSIARAAGALYRGALQAHDDNANWARTEREALSNAYQALLCDAAAAAIEVTSPRDVVDFAGRAIVLDPFSERACRLLMRGYAQMGETSLALREYERCRKLLHDERGVDPSPESRELHLAMSAVVRRGGSVNAGYFAELA